MESKGLNKCRSNVYIYNWTEVVQSPLKNLRLRLQEIYWRTKVVNIWCVMSLVLKA